MNHKPPAGICHLAAIVACAMLCTGTRSFAEEPLAAEKATQDYNILFIGSSYVASAGGQQNFAEVIFKSQGLAIKVAGVYGPGKGAIPMWYINAGEYSPNQQKRIAQMLKAEKEGTKDYPSAKYIAHLKSFNGKIDDALASKKWNCIVIGSYPPGGVTTDDFDRCIGLWVEKFRKSHPGIKIVLYSSWAKPWSCQQQAAIDEKMKKVAKENNILIAPAGRACMGMEKWSGNPTGLLPVMVA